jgi:hypothetical protein
MIDFESGRYANGCPNIIGFAPRKSTVALSRPNEQGADLTMKPMVAGKAAAQSRTHPHASLCVQRSILLNPSARQCLPRLLRVRESWRTTT